MAVSSTPFLSCSFRPSISIDASNFSALPVRCPPTHHRLSRGFQRLSTIPQRQLTPRVQAMKQTFSSFDELLEKSDKPVLVDFYATWCGPCQMMVPVLEKVSEALKDKIQVVKIDTEKYTKIAGDYRIEALPTFILFRDGKPYDRFEGAMPPEKLIQWIENALSVSK
ncbi:thioredoxin-like protein slr0233 [Dioscorea cayenensis subsp. rotundata]|uniref:Thioredoxin-like protein slr0233 n=1 Tax=Dioscorea cayennensis subsp. rotundata TaxID=55577 RepID=A0AB40BZU1_DIOCR|nr:thioredoxin-like protein slr0233 [Dioscorea cayenensis subsp. rotundata]